MKPPTTKSTDTQDRVALEPRIQAIIDVRAALQRDVNCCAARTFRLFQCTRRFNDANASPQVCQQHFERWRRHGLIGQPIADIHKKELKSYLTGLFHGHSSNGIRGVFFQEFVIQRI